MAKENWLVRLKQAWCGLSTEHDLSYQCIKREDYTFHVLVCRDCQAHFRSHKYDQITEAVRCASDELADQMARFNVNKTLSEAFPLNAGETQRFFKAALPFDRKAHAATRKHGPNGRFLPALTVAKAKGISKKLGKKKRARGPYGQFKGKK